MRRRVLIASMIAATLGGAIDLAACGDKFLRVGRGARFRRYAAVHPAAILIYPPATSTRAGIDELKSWLKRAGHRAVVLERNASVAAALVASPYDVIIADYSEADRLKAEVQSASSRASLLPILLKPSQAVQIEATRQYAYRLDPHAMTRFDALAEIDRLMESRIPGKAASN